MPLLLSSNAEHWFEGCHRPCGGVRSEEHRRRCAHFFVPAQLFQAANPRESSCRREGWIGDFRSARQLIECPPAPVLAERLGRRIESIATVGNRKPDTCIRCEAALRVLFRYRRQPLGALTLFIAAGHQEPRNL